MNTQPETDAGLREPCSRIVKFAEGVARLPQLDLKSCADFLLDKDVERRIRDGLGLDADDGFDPVLVLLMLLAQHQATARALVSQSSQAT